MRAILRRSSAPHLMLALASLVLSAAFAGASPTGSHVSLPTSIGSAKERPGPPVLYWPPADAPQLQNTGIWKAAPILVSGAAAYRSGEYLYQDYLYDDHGAKEIPDPGDPRLQHDADFSHPNGTLTYPTSISDANVADIVEVRIKPLSDATAFRVTLNTLKKPSLIGLTLALGRPGSATHPLPYGAGARAQGDVIVTIHPVRSRLVASVTDAATGTLRTTAPVSVDVSRRQLEIRVPHSAWAPGKSTARIETAVGLWDGVNDRYLLPGRSATATTPGGAGLSGTAPAFFNAAFRFAEPTPVYGAQVAQTVADTSWWRDRQQGAALAQGDLSPLHADVDFAKLARGVTDDSAIPTHGPIDRILASHFEPGQGTNYADSCYGGSYGCQYQGRLQPYAVYVPEKKAPALGYGMTLLLHANAANYNEFLGSHHAKEFGERGLGSIVATPEARDPGSSYIGLAAADVFEVWADIAHHYSLDPSRRTISGYSLGGLGTFKLAEMFPDLFSRAVAIVGSPGGPSNSIPQSQELASLRNIPTMIWDVLPVDELNPYSELNVAAMQKLGYRYDYLGFPGEHLSPAANDEYQLAADFLGSDPVDPNPSHVTYVYGYDTLDGLSRYTGDFPNRGLVADHAYWLSNLRLRNSQATCKGATVPGCGSVASVDAVSSGLGVSDAHPSGPTPGAGVQTGGQLLPVLPYLEVSQTWGAAPVSARSDSVTFTTTNLRSLTLDPARAGVDCKVVLHVSTDGPLAVTLAGCGLTRHFG